MIIVICKNVYCDTGVRVETGSGHPGHIFAGSSGSDLLYKISESDPDSALDHVRY